MKPSRIAAITALGLACISIALGCLYINGRNAQRIAAELVFLQGEPDTDSAEMIALIEAYSDMTYTLPALISGTLGVAALGFGVVMTILSVAERVGSIRT